MKKALGENRLILKESSIHGYGVFSKKKISPKAVIEKCPLLVLPKKSYPHSLINYVFSLSETDNALALGFGSLYNHSNTPNADYYLTDDQRFIIFKATRPIKSGEEIFISYGESWFQEREIVIRTEKASLWKRWRCQHSLRILVRFLLVMVSLYGLIYGSALFESINTF